MKECFPRERGTLHCHAGLAAEDALLIGLNSRSRSKQVPKSALVIADPICANLQLHSPFWLCSDCLAIVTAEPGEEGERRANRKARPTAVTSRFAALEPGSTLPGNAAIFLLDALSRH